jgi:hypothetical protein
MHQKGKIKGFSRGSRGRLLKTVGRLRQNVLPVFVTLTYPDDFPVTPERWQRNLAAMADGSGHLEKGIRAAQERRQ